MSKKEEEHSTLDLGLQDILRSLEGDVVKTSVPVEPIEVHSPQELKIQEIQDSLSKEDFALVLLAPSILEVFEFPLPSDRERDRMFSMLQEFLKRVIDSKEFDIGRPIVEVALKKDLTLEVRSTIRSYADASLERFRHKELSPDEMKESLAYHDILGAVREPAAEMTFAQSVVTPVPENIVTTPTSRQWKLPSRKFMTIALLLLCLGVGLSWYFFVRPAEGDLGDSFIEKSSIPLDRSLVPERDEVSTLDALMYTVQEDENKALTPLPSAAPSVEKAAQVVPSLPQAKVSIDTSGPVEPRKVEDLLDRKTQSRYEGDSDQGQGSDRNREHDLDRDRSDREREQDSRDRDRDRPSARRDPPTRPGRFETGVRYEVMINTSVFDRPSFNAKEVEELYVGDKVRVEARLGRWLKVRSRNGEPGYIMSQDTQKLFD